MVQESASIKIVFFCASLEAGKDGVGDYTRRFATALLAEGVSISIVALNDGYVSAIVTELPLRETPDFKVYRLPARRPWSERAGLALAWLKQQKPDWVSIQFVPFSFQPKGICWQLGGLLDDVKKLSRLHLMVHEPWLLWNSPLPLKLRWLGVIQRAVLKRLFSRYPPDAVSTALPLYQQALKGIGLRAELLPLFGNIAPREETGSRLWVQGRCGISLDSPTVMAGFFGQIHPLLSRKLLTDFITGQKQRQKRVVILHAGKLGLSGQRCWDDLVTNCAHYAEFVSLGHLRDEEASKYLHGLDYGLTSYSKVTGGKSGVIAAMREHKLPVIYCGDDALASEISRPAEAVPEDWSVDLAARKFLDLLAASERVSKKPNPTNLA